MSSVNEKQELSVPSDRLLSLDALRGFDMFWIIGGDLVVRSLPKIHRSAFTEGLAAQMDHCEWAGFHFYDLIFPMFVFIVGVSLVFSVSRMVERAGRLGAVKRISVRAVVLFLLGIFYMGGVADGLWRHPGQKNVNRRWNGTPDRRAKGTPWLRLVPVVHRGDLRAAECPSRG